VGEWEMEKNGRQKKRRETEIEENKGREKERGEREKEG
jgi:hypothetical protein